MRIKQSLSALLYVSAITLLTACTTMIDKYGLGWVAFDGEPIHDLSVQIYLPENAPSISQRFMPVDSMDHDGGRSAHEGIDILTYTGTAVIAPAPGTVKKAYRDTMYGNRLEIDHGNDEVGNPIITRYFHLDRYLVEVGQQVKRGQQIGELGMTGLLAPFPHLHFEVHKIDSENKGELRIPVNPNLFWVDGIGRVTCFDINREWPQSSFKITYPVPCIDVDWQSPEQSSEI